MPARADNRFARPGMTIGIDRRGLPGHPRQVNWIAHGLLDQIEGVDQHAEVGQAAGPELGEMGDPQGEIGLFESSAVSE